MATTDPADGGDLDDDEKLRSVESLLCGARDALRVERRRTVDEREAFEAFRSRVREIAAEATPTAGPGGAAGVSTMTGTAADPSRFRTGTGSTAPGLVAVRNAYLETVMSVPHYDEEYNDTYERSLAAEFSPEIAVALTREPTLHERYRSSLLAKTTEAVERREEFVDVLGTESASIARAREDLGPVREEVATFARRELKAADFGALDAYRARLTVLAEKCDGIAARRQRDRVDGERAMAVGEVVSDVQAYLYRGLSVTYPVLAAVATVGERIESIRTDVERAMAYAESSCESEQVDDGRPSTR